MPCKDPIICRTQIGKGDYEIEAVVQLYSLEGNEIDLAKIQFRVGTSYMVVAGTSENYVLMDQMNGERYVCFISSMPGFAQTFRVLIEYVPSVGKQDGQITVHGALTDRFGRSPKTLTYSIARWNGWKTPDCLPKDCPAANRRMTQECGPLKIEIDIQPDTPCKNYDVAIVSFLDLATNMGLVRDYKLGRRRQDPLYLFNQNLEERYTSFYPEGGIYSNSIIRQVSIRSLRLDIPRGDGNCGKLCIDGSYLAYNNWYPIQPQLLTSWNEYGEDCIMYLKSKKQFVR